MSEFKKVEHAQFSPTKCALCDTHEGPFIDTHLDIPVHGHVYICASNARRAGCIRQMARLDDMVEGVRLNEVRMREADLMDQIGELEAELETSRVIQADSLVAWFNDNGLVVTNTPTTSTNTTATRRRRKDTTDGE